MATPARLSRACQRETAKESPIYKEAEKTGNVSEDIHFLRVSKRAYEVKVSSTVRSTVEIPHDPKDDTFCLCSEQGKADFIVTFNPKDFTEDCLEAKDDASRSPPSVRGTEAGTKKVEASDSASH
jgi:predicted nucleic acid-binding protein